MISKIKEGRNNFVYLYKEKNNKFIIKKFKNYFYTKYDRYFTEKIFIEYLKKKRIKNIPNILGSNKKKRIIYFSYIDGKQIIRPKKDHLNKCLTFLKQINYKTTYKNFKFQKASDACLSIKDHINTCESRINKLIIKYNYKKNNESKKIYNFLKRQIIPEFKIIKSNIKNSFTKSQIKKKLNNNKLILSPSDFGFHNIITQDNQIYFIDFEYAGWDDPRKLLCDFILNPDYSILKKDKIFFLTNFDQIFKTKISNSDEFRVILKFHFLKWVCMIINQINLKFSKKRINMKYFKKAVNYFQINKKILK